MDAFVSRKRRRISGPGDSPSNAPRPASPFGGEEECTDIKLAILASLCPTRPHDDLLEILLSCDGSVDATIEILSSANHDDLPTRKRRSTTIGMQRSLTFSPTKTKPTPSPAFRSLTKKGKTLHLFSPKDIAAHTPCSIVHNFLPSGLATSLLQELLPEVVSYTSATFKLFDNVVTSPHSACFYVDNLAECERQKAEYLYNGSNLDDIRETLPCMRQVSTLVKEAVNKEIKTRISTHYPNGQKPRYQSSKKWQPNAAFVNCYDGGSQSVGYHSDQLSYLGPHPVIGSLSLGVAREFRVRKIVPKDEDNKDEAADASGQISIHLPHNSLLVMHAEMQEEWKHAITPAQSIDPHPLAGNKRINITYRWYREEFQPRYTPRCKCGVPTVLKTVQRQKVNRGRYMWMCQVGQKADEKGEGCGFFEWAQFTDDGVPVWKHRSTSLLVKEKDQNDGEGI